MWKKLETLKQLDQIVEDSNNKEIAIFKHSTSCGISRMVKRTFESDLNSRDKLKADVYYLDLLQFREISNQIADRFNVIHQSPQLVIIKDGLAIHDSSHHSINAGRVK